MRLPPSTFATLLLAIAVLLLGGCMSTPTRSTGSFVERNLEIAGETRRYQVFVPASAAGGRTPPVIVFLHGWPDLGIGWRHQLRCFAELGFRAVAPDINSSRLRGTPRWEASSLVTAPMSSAGTSIGTSKASSSRSL